MTPEKTEEAAKFLMAAWDARRREPSLPDDMKPANEGEAAAIAEAIYRLNTAEIGGWKIGATAEGARKALGLDNPFTGFIRTDCLDADGVVYEYAKMMKPVMESEYAFRMSADLPPRTEPYTRPEVEEAIASLIIGMEIPESRLGDDHGMGFIANVADHGGCGRFVVGAEFEDWRAIDCVDQDVVLNFDGEEVGRGTGAAMMGHPVEAVTWFANHLSARGITLKAGEFVSTGSCTGVIPVPKPCVCVADFGPLGKLTATFS